MDTCRLITQRLCISLCETFSLDFEITFRRNHFHKKQGESVCEEGDRAYAKIMTLVS